MSKSIVIILSLIPTLWSTANKSYKCECKGLYYIFLILRVILIRYARVHTLMWLAHE